MELKTYEKILSVLKDIIRGTKYENHVYTVGGCERDRLLDRTIKDVDLVVDLPNGGIDFAKYLWENGYTTGSIVVYEHYGTAMFRLKEVPEEEIEAVQTRKECYRDMETRNPETAFGTIQEDCMRRDFTINAIYRNVSTLEVLDLTGRSNNDLADRTLHTCGDPDVIFNEDPLRILRAVRFKCHGFDIANDVMDGMYRNRKRLNIISRERITDEFNKMIMSNYPSGAYTTLQSMDILRYVIPMEVFIGRFQGPRYFVERFIIFLADDARSFDNMPKVLEVRLAYLFRNFELQAVEEALKIMKYPNSMIKKVLWLIEHNILENVTNEACLRKTMYESKGDTELFYNLLDLIEKKDMRLRQDDGVFWKKKFFEEIRRKTKFTEFACMFNYKLPIDGNDIMKARNIEGGPDVKKILDKLMERVFYDPTVVTKDYCLSLIRKREV